MRRVRKPLPVVGWREWVGLPDLGVARMKAKIDTGARSSALHAYDLEPFERDGEHWVRFTIHPFQRDVSTTIPAEAKLLGRRWVRPSSGSRQYRPVIATTVELLGLQWPIELTLANRDVMGFRMLLGRQAIRRRCLVDPSRSFMDGRPAGKELRST